MSRLDGFQKTKRIGADWAGLSRLAACSVGFVCHLCLDVYLRVPCKLVSHLFAVNRHPLTLICLADPV